MSASPPPLEFTGHLLRRAQQVHLAAWNRSVSPEISSVQFAALLVLDQRPGASQAELGAELDLDRSTIADLVQRMAARGLITRGQDTIDRRRKVLRLTELGATTLSELVPRVEGLEPILNGGLNESERREFRRMLRAMLDSASASGLLSGEAVRPTD